MTSHQPAPDRREQPSGPPLETRRVEVADPSLSPEANERLTEEVRDAIGAEEVRVPADRPHPSRGEHTAKTGIASILSAHRAVWIGSLAAAVTLGAFLTLITGSWWFLPLAAGVHALGTLTVAVVVVRLTTLVERPDPTTAALLEEEGVDDAEEYFSEVVKEFAGQPEGANRRSAPAGEDPAAAVGEHRSAVTPTAGSSRPVGEKSLPGLVAWSPLVAIPIASIAVAAASGGWLWLIPAVTVPAAAGGAFAARLITPRPADGPQLHRRRLLVLLLGTVAAVAVFCVLVALLVSHK
jgi:hypothetical protein